MAFQPEPGTFYTIDELEASGIASRHTFRKWIKAGKLKASFVGRRYLIKGEDIQNILLKGTGTSQKRKKKKQTKHGRKK